MTWIDCLTVAAATALLLWHARPRRPQPRSLGARVQALARSPGVTLLHVALTDELRRALAAGSEREVQHLRWLLDEALPTLLAKAALNSWPPESAAFEAALADLWLLGLTPVPARGVPFREARRRVRSQGQCLGDAPWGTWVA